MNNDVAKIVSDTLSGKAHFEAWVAVCNALDKADPAWCFDGKKSAVQNAVEWIKTHADKDPK